MHFTGFMTMTEFFFLQQNITFDSHGNLLAQISNAVAGSTPFYLLEQDEEKEQISIDGDSDQDTVSEEKIAVSHHIANTATTTRRSLCPLLAKSKKLCKDICDRLCRATLAVSEQSDHTTPPLFTTTHRHVDWDLAVLEHKFRDGDDLHALLAWLYRNLEIRARSDELLLPVMEGLDGQKEAELLAQRLKGGNWWIEGDESEDLRNTVIDLLERKFGHMDL
ncbi:hypothetical protein CERZMDRAFT_94560 [Cercospora zeae-maydis SCOH1-5]|uniref:Uncharacterized protein n=1 Tax=Cercospora zeae-maydis SCOH1-5 TaxID=717836 RepID=A0A6A6FP07_9PEZI|nr:hypothetical protein CERZMDRAFT_94560 [Cercospora zeae-maydis SCOH1-5]